MIILPIAMAGIISQGHAKTGAGAAIIRDAIGAIMQRMIPNTGPSVSVTIKRTVFTIGPEI